MKDSFVIHSEYIEDLPEENKPEYLMYIYNYGCKGIEPELTGLALTVWIKIKRRIDEDEEAYNKKLKGNSTGGKKHTGNQYTRVNNGSQWKSMEVVEVNLYLYMIMNLYLYMRERENRKRLLKSPLPPLIIPFCRKSYSV